MSWWLKSRNPPIDESEGFHPVQDAFVKRGGAWRSIEKAYVQLGGTWHQFYTNVPSVGTSISATVSDNGVVVAPNKVITVSGSVTAGSGIPPTGSRVELRAGGTVFASALTTSTGAFTINWTPTTAGSYGLTVRHVANGLYTMSQTSVIVRVMTNTSTTISVPSSVLVCGEPFTATVNVAASTGQVVPGGTITFFHVPAGTATSITLGTATVVNGVASRTLTIPVGTTIGACEIRARYNEPAGPNIYITSLGTTPTITLKSAPVPSPFTIGWTTPDFTITWSAAANATAYRVVGVDNSLNVTLAGTARTYKITPPTLGGINPDPNAPSRLTYYVVASNDNNSVASQQIALRAFGTTWVTA